MTAHHPDWREWLESLNAAGAEYVVVGGVALAFHGIVRYTGDLDVLVHTTPGNARRVIEALHAFGLGSLDVSQLLSKKLLDLVGVWLGEVVRHPKKSSSTASATASLPIDAHTCLTSWAAA